VSQIEHGKVIEVDAIRGYVETPRTAAQ